jgi:hypothetical protein
MVLPHGFAGSGLLCCIKCNKPSLPLFLPVFGNCHAKRASEQTRREASVSFEANRNAHEPLRSVSPVRDAPRQATTGPSHAGYTSLPQQLFSGSGHATS